MRRFYKLLCRLGFHRGTWSDDVIEEYGEVRLLAIRMRTCETCGVEEWRARTPKK